ncbi:hypothetical protein [Streptomyces sp. NPDC015130]|uniref:hypothetical protein n=1 Tax=Streptomyces sp. NPDC015130 TaxID=3364940 RepID=UPI0036F6A006
MAASAAPAQVQAVESGRAQPTPPPPAEEEVPVDPPAEEPPVEEPPVEEPPVDEQVPPVEEEVPPEEEQVPPGEEQPQYPDGEEQQNPAEEEANPAEQPGELPAEGEEVPAVQNVALQTLTATEIKQQVDTRISTSGLSAAEKAKAQKSLDGLLAIINDPTSTKAQKEAAESLATGMGEALRLSQDPTLSKAEQARFNKIARGISEAAGKFTDPKATIADKIIYGKALEDLNLVVTNLTDKNVTPEAKAFYAKYADVLLGGLVAAEQTGTAPTKPEDKKKVKEKLAKSAAALKVYQSASSSDSDRSAAKATLDEQAGAVNNSQYQALVEELKRLKAPQSCLDVVQNRTQQAGWPDGSLWGLTDKACEDTVQAGAADTNSDWNGLFECVLDQPFSTCTNRIPE